MWQDRITVDEEILSGKLLIKGTRISIEFIIELLAEGWQIPDIIKNYPQLCEEDIYAALKYCARIVRKDKSFVLK